MLLYRPKQKISTTESEEVKFPASSIDGLASVATSGSYNDLTDKPTVPGVPDVVQTTGTSTTSVMSQKATTDAVNSRLSKTDNTDIEVLGTKKATTTLGGNQLYSPNGMIFGGTAAAAGLVTRGICGVSTPSAGGACSKDNVYVNYDGNNDFNANRQIVLNAGTPGSHLGSNMYQYAVPRGDVVKNWVEAKDYVTSVKVNGNTVASSGGVVDIGTVVTDVSGKQDKITSSNKLAASLVSGLSTVATSGSYNDLSNKPTDYVTTADKAQTVNGVKTFVQNIVRKSSNIDISTDPTNTQYAFIDFLDKNDKRIAVIGSHYKKGKYSGAYLQAKNVASMGIEADDKDNVKTFAPTPPDTDSSTQLATTEWVRRFANPAYLRGTDSNTTYKGYYKIAEATLNEWYRTSVARIFVQDVDSTENGVLNVSVYAGGDGKTHPTSVTTVNMGFLEGINPNAYFRDFFVVVRKKSLTVRGSMKIELWYRQPNEWGRISFSFLTDIPDSRNVSVTNKWTKFSRTSAQERAYISKNVVDLDNGFIPYDSFNESAFTTEDYPVAEIYDNSTNQAQFSAGALRIANSEYARSDKPTTASKRNIIFTDKNNASIATIQSSVGSTWNGLNFLLTNKSGGGNSIEFVHDTNRSVWRFNPASSSLPIELGEPNRPWNNAYIKNIVADSVTADNLPFTSDGLSTGTLGATTKLASGRYYIERDITINNNTTHIAVVVEGTGNYVYVPARISAAMNFIGVSLISSGTNLVSVSMTLHDSSGSIVDNTTVTAGTYKYKLLD